MWQPLANLVARHCSDWSLREAAAVGAEVFMECEHTSLPGSARPEPAAVGAEVFMECESGACATIFRPPLPQWVPRFSWSARAPARRAAGSSPRAAVGAEVFMECERTCPTAFS